MRNKISVCMLIIMGLGVCAYPAYAKLALEWEWSGGTTMPDYKISLCTPLVVNLNDDNKDHVIDLDDIPDIVFVATNLPGGKTGPLRAISGLNGAEIFTVKDPAYLCFNACDRATGDIDNDGLPEIISVSSDSTHLYAFEHDGTFKWKSDTSSYSGGMWGCLHLVDLDSDNKPEIIFGADVWDHEGVLLWSGLLGRGGNIRFCSVCADLDMDGSTEVIAGNTAYTASGGYYWIKPALPDGHTTVADLNLDGIPEVVLLDDKNFRLYLLNNDGTTLWGPVTVPGSGFNVSMVTIADFNGDTFPEIVLTLHETMSMFDKNGTVVWSQHYFDHSGAATPAAFDVDLDGAFEIIYSDEEYLHVINGKDGIAIDSIPIVSGTGSENPAIADVDNDDIAEVVVVTTRTDPGIKVFTDQTWPPARKIWNQFNYRITNVRDTGRIPVYEPYHWLFYNTVRAQTGGTPVIFLPHMDTLWIVLLLFVFSCLYILQINIHN